jgi:flagellar biosynthetic protein FliP
MVAFLACLLVLGAFSGALFAQGAPSLTVSLGGGADNDPANVSSAIQIVLLMTVLTLAPSLLMLMTSFTRILIVFSLLRQALGLQSMPPNMVLIGLSFFLTLFVMNPTFEAIYQDAYLPYTQQKISFEKAVEVGTKPIKAFMLKQTRQEDLAVFVRLYDKPIEAKEDVPMTVLIPAFAISEIKTGFLIGFMIYLPFIAIDFAVASILTSLGMVMISPMMFSLPLKLVIFALADGWALLAASLIESYRIF